MRDELKQSVCDAGRAMAAANLAFRAWGSVSAVDRESNLAAITPAGGADAGSAPGDSAVVPLDGGAASGPAANADAPTHAAIYRQMTDVAAVALSFGPVATAWAQARRAIPAFGAIHAELVGAPVPCTLPLPDEHAPEDCDEAVARAVADAAGEAPDARGPGVLIANLCLVTFGAAPAEAVERAEIVEHVARLATLTGGIEPYPRSVSPAMLRWRRVRRRDRAET